MGSNGLLPIISVLFARVLRFKNKNLFEHIFLVLEHLCNTLWDFYLNASLNKPGAVVDGDKNVLLVFFGPRDFDFNSLFYGLFCCGLFFGLCHGYSSLKNEGEEDVPPPLGFNQFAAAVALKAAEQDSTRTRYCGISSSAVLVAFQPTELLWSRGSAVPAEPFCFTMV